MTASSGESISTRLLHDEHQARLTPPTRRMSVSFLDSMVISVLRFIGQPGVVSVARFRALRYNALSYQLDFGSLSQLPDDLPRETYPVSAR